MAQTLGGLTLPNYRAFEELNDSRVSKNISLDGTMYVDHTSTRKGWRIEYDVMSASDYAALRAKYESQLSSEAFLDFIDTDLGIDEPSWLTMPDERKIVWDKTQVIDLEILLEPRDADSI